MIQQPTEPSADLREFASFVRQMFVALVNEGFTETQALTVVADVMTANFRGE